MHNDASGLLALMDGQGIERAVVGAVEAILYRDAGMARDLLLERLEAAGRPAALLPAAVVNPAFPGWERDLEEWAAAGAVAVKAYPNYHGYAADGPRALALAEAAAEKGLPVICCVRVEDERNHHPLMLVPPVAAGSVARLAAAVPGAKVVLACGNQGEIETFLGEAGPGAQAWAEVSYLKSPTNAVEHMAAKVGAERLLYGSHAPFIHPGVTRIKIERAAMGAEDKARILGGNAAALWA